MLRYITLAVIATCAAQATELPSDPFQRAATKALRGDYGKLKPWQRNAYRRGLEQGANRHRALVTIYGPWEGYSRGEGCRWGYGCSEEIAAANALPGGTVVWLARPAGLRVIGDTGARGNDAWARRKGCKWWLDLWVPRIGWGGLANSIYKRDVWVIPPQRKATRVAWPWRWGRERWA